MQKRLGAALSLLVALALLAPLARACGGHGALGGDFGLRDGPAAWERQFEVKGRSRSLLSMKGRRCVAIRV